MDATTLSPAPTCTTREAAKRLGVSLRTVQLWTESGVLEAWKTAGGHRRVLCSAVDRLISEREEAVTRPPTPRGALDILVVEDDPTLLSLYRYNLADTPVPVTVRTASNGYEGLIRLGEQRPDVLVTDLMMPGIDGFQMLRTLTARPEFSAVQVVVVTGLHRADIEARGGLPAGVVVFGKPVPFDRLITLISDRAEALRAKVAA